VLLALSRGLGIMIPPEVKQHHVIVPDPELGNSERQAFFH
jgi:hypothetical protein